MTQEFQIKPLNYTLAQFTDFARDYGLPAPRESGDVYSGRTIFFGTARRGFMVELDAEGNLLNFRTHDDEFRQYQTVTSDSPYTMFHMLLADARRRIEAGPKRGHVYVLAHDTDQRGNVIEGRWYVTDTTEGVALQAGDIDHLRQWLGWEFDSPLKRQGEAKL